MQVTIIVPIHNSEKYLEECLNSALSQSFWDIEILCIDGGSTDLSGEIVTGMQESDDRIVAIHDKNTSYGHKLNVGIGRAKGKYIAILESDDRMEPDMIEKLYSVAEKYDADVTDADYYEFLDYKGMEIHGRICKYVPFQVYNRLVTPKDKLEQRIATNGIWTALYKRDFLIKNQIYLNESPGASFQDTSFLFLTSFLAEKAFHLDIPLYGYRVDNEGSSVKDNSKVFEIVGECEFLKNELRKRRIKEPGGWDMYYVQKYTAFYWNYCRLSMTAGEKFLERYEEELGNDIKNGKINRERFTSILYHATFLLLDDKEKFMESASMYGCRPPTYCACLGYEKVLGKDIVLFGTGRYGVLVYDVFIQCGASIQGICDNSPNFWGDSWDGLTITSVKQAVETFPDALYFITSRKNRKEMTEQLLKEKIKVENIMVLPL